MALMDYLIGKRKNPMKESAPYMEQAQQLFQPYQQQGLQASGLLQDVTGQLATDPAGYLENLMKGYQQSPYAKMQTEEALKATGAAAAAGGTRGTQSDLMQSARIADLISGQDMQQYLANAMGLMGTGLQGQQQLYGGGLQAAGQQGGILGTQAGMAAQQAQEANKQRQQLIGSLLGLIGGGGAAAMIGAPQNYGDLSDAAKFMKFASTVA